MTWQNHFNSKSFEEFNKAFFKAKTWQYFDETVIIQIDNDRHVEISLEDGRESSGTYTYYRAKLVNKKSGPISSHDFDFSALDGPANDGQKSFKLVRHCGYDWYMNGPTRQSVDALTTKIVHWIECVQ